MVTMMTESGIGTAVYRPPEHFLVGLQTLHLHLAADKLTLLQWGDAGGWVVTICQGRVRAGAGAILPWLLTSSCTCSGE